MVASSAIWSLFTFESFCIILANSFFKNCLTCVKVQFLHQESKQTFPENLKFMKRDYHFQTEVVLHRAAERLEMEKTSQGF